MSLSGYRLMSLGTYIKFFSGAACVLDPAISNSRYKLQRLEAELAYAWASDTRSALMDSTFGGPGSEAMSFAQFFNALFELVDMWTMTTSASEYVDLSERLYAMAK